MANRAFLPAPLPEGGEGLTQFGFHSVMAYNINDEDEHTLHQQNSVVNSFIYVQNALYVCIPCQIHVNIAILYILIHPLLGRYIQYQFMECSCHAGLTQAAVQHTIYSVIRHCSACKHRYIVEPEEC